MQFRSLHLSPPEWAQTRLDPDFPIHCGRHTVENREINKLHIHNVLELGLCLSGNGTFVVEEKVFQFEAGDVFLINHLEMHRACVSRGPGAPWVFVMADPAALLKGRLKDYAVLNTDHLSGSKFRNRFPKDAFPAFHRLLAQIVDECGERSRFYQDRVAALLLDFLIEMNRLFPPPPSRQKARPARDAALMQKLRPAVEHISREFGSDLDMVTLGRLCGLSAGHFRRLFTRAFGKGPKAYLNDYRISMAGNLLRSTDQKILRAALDCGFPTLSCFNRQFRKKTGMAPREFRKSAFPNGSSDK